MSLRRLLSLKPRLLAEAMAHRLSPVGLAGIALVVSGLAAWPVVERDFEREAAQLQGRGAEAAGATTPAAEGAGPSDNERLQAFHDTLPLERSTPQLLKQLFGIAAKAGVELLQGDFQRFDNAEGRYVELRFVVAAVGDYRQIRRFVDGALAELRSLALDDVVFERDTVGDTHLNATLRFRLMLAPQG
jgi:hypothetical protein